MNLVPQSWHSGHSMKGRSSGIGPMGRSSKRKGFASIKDHCGVGQSIRREIRILIVQDHRGSGRMRVRTPDTGGPVDLLRSSPNGDGVTPQARFGCFGTRTQVTVPIGTPQLRTGRRRPGGRHLEIHRGPHQSRHNRSAEHQPCKTQRSFLWTLSDH